jgi:hypothetical protein
MKQLDIKKAVFAKAKNKVLLTLLFCVYILPAFAGIFTVTTTADTHAVDPAVSAFDGGGNISLRSAIERTDFLGGTSTINLPAGTYTLTLGSEISFGNVAEDITIVGADNATTIIDGNSTDRIFLINPPGNIADVHTTLQNITFQNGLLLSDVFGGGAILAGGPTNSLTIQDCVFSANNIDPSMGTTGGALNFAGGGDLSIDSSLFSSNGNPVSDGGAVYFFLPNNESGSLSITNSSFKNNIVFTTGGATGGAIGISTQGSNPGTFTATINHNTFKNNGAQASGDQAGDISVNNGFGGNVVINYNRFKGSAANTDPQSLLVSAAAGGANATNNWWGFNDDPTAAGFVGGAGPIVLTDWIILTLTPTPATLCTIPLKDTSLVTASFLKTNGGATLSTADISTLLGVPITFNGANNGSLAGTVPTTIDATTGVDTLHFVANAAGTGYFHALIDNMNLNSFLLTPISISPITLPTTTAPFTPVVVTQNVGDEDNEYFSTCQLLDSLAPTGALPVSGSVTSKVWVESSVPSLAGVPFVARHYQIEPATLPLISTGTVTLYFTQQEFTDFNNDPSNPLPLPDSATDAPGIANLRVAKYSGVSGDGSGLPASYLGPAIIIDPADGNIVWDAVNNRWAVTFDVTSFSGFIIQTASSIIPVNLINFTATLTTSNSATVNWNMANQSGIKSYVVEKSTDDASFSEITSVPASTINSYSYVDATLKPGTSYYRLGMVDEEGKINYGPTAKVSVQSNQDIVVYPDPVTDKFFIKQLSGAMIGTAQLSNINGQVLQTIQITQSLQPVDVSTYPSGIYMLHFSDGSVYRIIKK